MQSAPDAAVRREEVSAPFVENRAGGAPLGDRIREVWDRRELALVLAGREVTARYRQAAFGIAWAVIQPVAAAILFTAVFGRLADVPSDGLPYAIFVFAGLVAWTYFSSSVGEASEILVDNNDLVTKVYFPRLLVPLSAVLPPLIDAAVSLVILAVLMVAYGVAPGPALATAPLWIGLLVLAAFAAGVWLSALNVRFRDVRHALAYLLQLWFFVTPVVFPSSLAEGGWRYLLAANPLTGIVDGLRWSLVGGPAPGPELAISMAALLVLLVGGLAFFRRAERFFADVI
jgi:ABC-type polysaccharide/polyol phosphate export permease